MRKDFHTHPHAHAHTDTPKLNTYATPKHTHTVQAQTEDGIRLVLWPDPEILENRKWPQEIRLWPTYPSSRK